MKRNQEFLNWLDEWFKGLKPATFKDLKIVSGKTALVSVDMVKGFCSTGPLVSPDIAAIIPEIVSLFQNSHKLGIKHFLLFQDTHHPETPEFTSYPPHCLKGSGESGCLLPAGLPSLRKIPSALPTRPVLMTG